MEKLSDANSLLKAQKFMDQGHERIGLGDIDGAAGNWEKAMEYYAPFKIFYFVIADYYSKAGNVNEACSYYLKTAINDKYHEQAIMELGVCEIHKKNWSQAIAYFQKSLDLVPNQALAYFYIATSYGVLKKHELAKLNLDKALLLQPSLSKNIDSESVLFKYK